SNSDHSRGPTINRNEDHRRALLTELIGLCSKRAELDICLVQDPRVANHETVPVNRTSHAFANGRIKVVYIGERKFALFCLVHDRAPEPVLAAALEARGKPESLVLRDPRG